MNFKATYVYLDHSLIHLLFTLLTQDGDKEAFCWPHARPTNTNKGGGKVVTVHLPPTYRQPGMYARRMMRLIFDFDGTIVTKDTISTLALASIAAKQSEQHHADLKTRWTAIEGDYMKDYNDYKTQYSPSAKERKTLPEELKYLSGLRAVEEASLKRVHDAGIFQNLTATSLFDIGKQVVNTKEVEVRPGFGDMLDLAAANAWDVSVLSINWSKAFVEGVLSGFGNLRVVANEISADDGIIKGPLETDGRRMACSDDKLLALQKILGASNESVVYFGDSTTDIQCLLHDHGVVIGDADSSLVTTLKRTGTDVPSASETVTGKVCWAADFEQVLQNGVLDKWTKQT